MLTTTGGQTGVFDVNELVTVLREENGRDICVIAVPKEMNYVDHLVLVTGRSTRHITALAEYVRWLVSVSMYGCVSGPNNNPIHQFVQWTFVLKP